MADTERNLSYPALGSEKWERRGEFWVIPISHPKVDPFLCVCDRLQCSCDCVFLMTQSPLPTKPALPFWTALVIKSHLCLHGAQTCLPACLVLWSNTEQGCFLHLIWRQQFCPLNFSELGFPGGNAGDLGSIPRLGRSSGEGNGHPLQYSCLGNPMNRGAWWATVHGVTKSQTQLSN